MSNSQAPTARQRRKRRDILASAPPIESWSAPREKDVPQADQEIYYANKLAVEMWVKGSTETEITKATRLSAADARRLAQRCITLNKKTKTVHGFWACLPNRRLEQVGHKRRNAFDADLAKEGKGRTGALNDVFKRYPSIAKGMLEFASKRRVGTGAPTAIVTRGIVHETFIALCKVEKLDERTEYPFDAERRGYKAIWEWYLGCMEKSPVAAALNLLGDEAAKLAARDYAGIGSSPVEGRRLAYERVELDEHYLDGMFTVAMPIGRGRFVSVKATRLWALVLREVESKAVLACGISFGQRYSTTDVLALVHRALCPPKRTTLTFSNPHYQYRSDAAFPAELPDFIGNGWQTLALDSDSTHLSEKSLGAARDIVKCNVVSERVGDASARGCIEGFFPFLSKLMESSPAATGNKPDSNVRRDPEAAAMKWNIVGTLAEQILDLFCRNFNATPSAAAGGVSPLTRLSELKAAGEFFRFPLNDLSAAALWKLLPMESATATRRRGDSGFGPLGVNLFGGRYVGPELARDHELAFAANKDVSVYVQEDARFAFVVPAAFPERVYPVILKGKYSVMPHTLSWRRLTSNAEKTAAIAGKADSPQIMFGLLQGLGEAAKTDGEATSALAGAVSFMNRFGHGDVEYVDMTAEQRARLVAHALAEDEEESFDDPAEVAKTTDPSASVATPRTTISASDPFGLL